MLANLMTAKRGGSYRILFLQIQVIETKKNPSQVQATIKEFEIQEGR